MNEINDKFSDFLSNHVYEPIIRWLKKEKGVIVSLDEITNLTIKMDRLSLSRDNNEDMIDARHLRDDFYVVNNDIVLKLKPDGLALPYGTLVDGDIVEYTRD